MNEIRFIDGSGVATCALCEGCVSAWSALDREDGVSLVARRDGTVGIAHARCVRMQAAPAMPITPS